MGGAFRESKFVDFDTGVTKLQPMVLRQMLGPNTSLAAKLLFFECRVEVWTLAVAVQVLKQIESHELPSTWSHAAYGMMSIAFSYFEMIGKTLNPNSAIKNTASNDFNYGFCDVYPEFMPASGNCDSSNVPKAVNRFRDLVRNGLYHLAWTKKNLLIHNNPSISKKDFDVEQRTIGSQTIDVYRVNPHSMVRTLVDHFPTFIERLENPDAQYNGIRRKFEDFIDTFHEP